jgi:hypothetical protein
MISASALIPGAPENALLHCFCFREGILLETSMQPFDRTIDVDIPMAVTMGKVVYHHWTARIYNGEASILLSSSRQSTAEKAQRILLRELAEVYPTMPDLASYRIDDIIELAFSDIIEKMQRAYQFTTEIKYEPKSSQNDSKYTVSFTTYAVKSELFGVNSTRAEKPEEVLTLSQRSLKVLLLTALEQLAIMVPHYKPLDSYR